MKVDSLKVEYIATSSLTPYARNARAHPPKQVQQIKTSITAVGFTNPILADEALVVIAGHGRLLAARELKMERVPVIRLSGLSDVQRRQLRIADNKIALNSAWDMDLLQVELQSLAGLDLKVDFDLTGFSVGEIEGFCQVKLACAQLALPLP